ncbi:BTAD domain-containing putative transcriptional regulator [Jidongwangia harbinensis]|uniref:BTAD domain-containing putative transcriptional regulator n=1 Tax=Jidongwangia harbinensis TaxID=2878561 RepID=UPI001CD977AE|nr:BTAD domain-containing putative transcriptional regulator [Jidongwangia harbinensis]MCA2216303.1 hypothetical protein [Jidongwangia harbinensis]MCA2217038.1 hypothetical protein [Jidongwangia harbinensis]
MIGALNRLATSLLVLVLVVGPPAAVVVWTARQPWRDLDRGEVLEWAGDPPPEALVWLVVGSGIAALWLLTAVLVVRAASVAGRRAWRRLRRLPLPTPAQATATSLAGTAMLALPAGTGALAGIASQPAAAGNADHDSHDPLSSSDERPMHAADADIAQGGIALPGGGWVPYPTALAVTALSTLIWLHRRHRYQPGPQPLGHHRHDADLQPLPETAEAITAAVTAADPTPPAPTPAADVALLTQLPAGRLTLCGPGAADAARGLLVTAALHAALHHSSPVDVVLRRHDLRLLLGTDVAESLPPGLGLDTTTVPGDPGHESHPAYSLTAGSILRVTRRGGPSAGRNTSTAPSAPAPDDVVTVVTVSDRPTGAAGWDVRADGAVSNAGPGVPRRLCVLTPHAATDLLRLVQHLGSATPPPSTPAEPAVGPAIRGEPAGRLKLLGGCDLFLDGAPVRLRRTAGLQVLAFLAVHPDGATTTDLVRALWPGHPPAAITKRLHTTLTDLRQQLAPRIAEPVRRRDERYLLNTDAITSDLHALRHAVTGAAAALTAEERQTALRTVIDTYRGDLAAGFSWPWLHPAREQLRRDLIDAYLQMAAVSNSAHAVEVLRAAATVDPYNAEVHQRAQKILRATGDHHAADALHQAYTQRLAAAGLGPTTVTNSTTGHRR